MDPVRDQSQIHSRKQWDAINRFTILFNHNVYQDDFNGSCQQAFALAINACQQGQWMQLAQARDDMVKLVLCWKTSLLNHAIAEGENEWTKQLIHYKIDIHLTDFEGNTPLHTAAKRGTTYLIDLLCSHINLDAANHKKQTPLHMAIEAGHHLFVSELIKKGANINRPIPIDDDAQMSLNALGLATMKGEKDCIDILINSPKCDIKFLYQNIGGLLHVAIYFHQFDVLKYLLQQYKSHFELELKNQHGLTPLSYAASLDEQEAIYLLHHYGASIDTKDYNDCSPIVTV